MAAPVLLGVPDVAIEAETSWDINKIGGMPDSVVPLQSIICERCGRLMPLVVQIYCPLDRSPFHRVLQVFTCTTKSCWNTQQGWRVFRSQLLDRKSTNGTTKHKDAVTMETSDWCDEANDWGSDEDEDDLVAMVSDKTLNSENQTVSESCVVPHSPVASEASEDSVDNASLDDSVVTQMEDLDVTGVRPDVIEEACKPDREVVENALGYLATSGAAIETNSDSTKAPGTIESFKPFYLNVFDEPTNEMTNSSHVTKLLKEYERRERVDVSALVDYEGDSGKRGSREKYETTEVKHGDKFFHKFMKRLRVCPEQVVRYQYGGSPLPITHPHGNLAPPPCQSCGSSRVFELQLLPPLIPYLAFSTGPAVEFGTVMVFTCSQSCWEDSLFPREEFVISQADPDQHLFKT